MNYDWYPWYIQAWRKNTMHLTVAQDGAYRRLIDEYMLTRGPLPDNDMALARIVGVGPDEWAALAPAVRPFFEASNGKLAHSRCEQELMAQLKQSNGKAIAGALGAAARWKDHRKNDNKYNVLKQTNGSAMADTLAKHGTRQDKERKEVQAAQARSPDGEPRAAPKLQASSSLKRLVAAKGWA